MSSMSDWEAASPPSDEAPFADVPSEDAPFEEAPFEEALLEEVDFGAAPLVLPPPWALVDAPLPVPDITLSAMRC